MATFYFVLLCLIVIFENVQGDSTEIPQSLRFHISYDGKEIFVDLAPIKTFLANANVPVWIADAKHSTKLIPMNDIMKELSPFTMYWDTSSCAAAVYYHKRKDFDVITGQHNVIRKFHYNETTNEVNRTPDTIISASMRIHKENRSSENIPLIMHPDEEPLSNRTQSLLTYPDRVFIETLVIVNYDVVEELEHNYAEIVSYVLTSFNMVDMLYSKIEIPNIRINIAGIIIGTSRESFPKLRNCYQQSDEIDRSDREIFEMDARCSLQAIYDRTLENYKDMPFQSYDIAFFITRHELFEWVRQTVESVNFMRKQQLLGLNWFPLRSSGYRVSSRDTATSIVTSHDIYTNFATIAHEMAHSFDVPHDGGPLWKEDGTCQENLMRSRGSYCNRCLRFGEKTLEHFRSFFSSHWGCIFRNEPTSLDNPQGPQKFLSDDEQCKCYGYKAAQKSMNCLPINRMLSWSMNCRSRLVCLDENNRKHRTAVYMNGTPCDREKVGSKVCWNSECIPVLKKPASALDNLRNQ